MLVVLMTFALRVSAQQHLEHPEYYLGVRAGVMASTVMFSPEVAHMTPITSACTLSPTGGLVFRYVGQKSCGLQVEVNYQQRGWAEKNEDEQYIRRLHYVEVPMLMHLHFGRGIGRFLFSLGPQIGYCVLDDGGNGVEVNYRGDEYGPVRAFDWGIAAGIGGQVRTLRAGNYEIEARFAFGLGSLFSKENTDFKTLSNPMELSVTVGWYMPLRSLSPSPLSQKRSQAR